MDRWKVQNIFPCQRLWSALSELGAMLLLRCATVVFCMFMVWLFKWCWNDKFQAKLCWQLAKDQTSPLWQHFHTFLTQMGSLSKSLQSWNSKIRGSGRRSKADFFSPSCSFQKKACSSIGLNGLNMSLVNSVQQTAPDVWHVIAGNHAPDTRTEVMVPWEKLLD